MRKRLFPIVIGVAIGMIEGFKEACSTLRSSEWLAHGLYNMSSKLLVRAVDYRVLVVCAACCLIFAIWAVRYKVNSIVRHVLDLVTFCCLLIALNFDFGGVFEKFHHIAVQTAGDMNISVFHDMIANGLPQIAASMLVITAGIFYLSRIRVKQKKTSRAVRMLNFAPAIAYISSFISPVVRRVRPIIARHWEFDAVVLIVFTGLNLIPLGFHIADAYALSGRPNIILIQVDALRADHLSCYGYKRNTSPNIDKLASDSMRFQKAISTAPWTSASVAGYMTSRYLHVSLINTRSGVPANVVQLSEALKDHGYATLGVCSNYLAGAGRGFAQGYDSYDGCLLDVSSPKVVSTALKRLDAVKNRKFFMFLLFMDPHSPYILHKKYDFYPGYKGRLGNQIKVSFIERTDHMPADDLKYIASVYDSEIAYTDSYIGKLINELKKRNLYNDTLIVFLSDHGEAFGEHGRLEHGPDLYDEALSVPLIIKLPGQHKGSTVGGVFPLIDLFPSIMDAIHYSTSAFGLDGVARHLEGMKIVRDTDIYSATDFWDSKLECIRSQSYKLIKNMDSSKEELYALRQDPAEKHNIIKSAPEVASLLGKAMEPIAKEMENVVSTIPHQDNHNFSNKEAGILRSLGYMQ